MLSINNLSFYFGSRIIYEEANLHVRPKDRIGLVGANGTGKSTLLRLIVGEYTPDAGEISKSKDCQIGFLNQDLLSYQTDESILQVAMQAFAEQNQLKARIDEILKALETDYTDALIEELSDLQTRFEALEGYSIQAKAEEILEGLGFNTEDLQRPLREFSGGWRMRVMLAKLLLEKPELLLLDEPTNHLDLPSIQWIENYIQTYEGAVITVSHDRQFLDNASNIIVEVSGGKLNYYSGNYDFYLNEKALRQEIQQAAYENQQQKIKQTERFIERFRSKATKARQVQSRVKALERMDMVEEVREDNPEVSFRFNFNNPSGKVVMELENLGKAYDEKVIFKNSDAVIERGDKIALIGANGKGKSTLLRIIAGSEKIEGQRKMGHNVSFSFFAQHQLESLNLDNALLDELKQAGSHKTETELRNILGCFLFQDEAVFKKIKVLSGGEKSRVAMAKVLISQANFLLLDEPTNHLDMSSVNILIQALQQYEGTYLVVSHDRHFISQVANKIWYIEGQQIKEYPGNYAEYQDWDSKRQANLAKKQVAQVNKKAKSKKQSKPQTSEEEKAAKKTLKQKQKQLEELEQQIMQNETTILDLEKQMALPENYSDSEKMKSLSDKKNNLQNDNEALQNRWDRLAEEIDELNNN